MSRRLLATAVLLSSLCITAMAQKVDTILYHSPYQDLSAVPCARTIHTDNQGRLNGAYTVKGSHFLNGGQRSDRQEYAEQRTYRNGKAHGNFTQAYSHSGSGQISGKFTITHNWTVSGRFADGIPEGTWIFAVNSVLNSISEKEKTNLRETVVFENGNVSSITDQDGYYLNITPTGISGTATLKDGSKIVLNNSVVTNTYLDLEGTRHKITNDQTFMLRKYLDGEWDAFELADHGYAIDWQETFLSQWSRFSLHANRYAHLDRIASRFASPSYSVRIGQLREIQTVADEKALEYYRQRPHKFYEMMMDGCYQGTYGRKYFGSKGANMIRKAWAQNQKESIGRKLSLISRIQENDTWPQCILDCAEGNSPLLDLIAFSRPDSLNLDETYREAARLYREKFTNLYPIVGYRMDTTFYTPSEGINSRWEIYKMSKDSVSYESYLVNLYTDIDGYFLISHMDPGTYRRIPNLWDTVATLKQKISAQDNALRQKLGRTEYREDYVQHYESVLADQTIIPEVRMRDLLELDSLQHKFEDNIPLITEIESLNLQIRNLVHRYKCTYRAYREYYDANRPEWDDDTQRLATMQNRMKQIISDIEHADMLEVERQSKRGSCPLF